ncbi:RHS repeat-associated core domain-containing protein, partial [Parabacteroides distasonis]|nr:RHS repeat-associated core domain-containing protein [Parabacteroides distasonis]
MNLLRKWVLVSLLLTIGVNVFAQESAYAYDANGNLTKNLNKNIVDIQYNCLNLPSRVLFGNGDNISNVYSGDGTKLRTIRVIGGDTLTTDYCGNAIYENGVLVRLMTEVGYITMADTTYHYFIKDHQGNVRVVADERGNVEEVNDYYPFGGLMSTSSRRSVQPYK